jgi:hypothetical protein
MSYGSTPPPDGCGDLLDYWQRRHVCAVATRKIMVEPHRRNRLVTASPKDFDRPRGRASDLGRATVSEAAHVVDQQRVAVGSAHRVSNRANASTDIFGVGAPKANDEGMTDFWRRKQIYLDQLAAERNPGAIGVSLADKVRNARLHGQ